MRKLPPLLRLWRLVSLLDMPALFAGGIAAVAGQRWGAYVLVVNVFVQIAFHVAVGRWAYRDVMSRPWPQVSPVAEDEWDD